MTVYDQTKVTELEHTHSLVTTGGFGGLSPPLQGSKPPPLKSETLWISEIFVKFECQAPRLYERKSPPFNNLPATVLHTHTVQRNIASENGHKRRQPPWFFESPGTDHKSATLSIPKFAYKTLKSKKLMFVAYLKI